MSETNDVSPFVTTAEAAAFLKVSRSLVIKLVESGHIPSIRVGHTIRIRKQYLEELAGHR